MKDNFEKSLDLVLKSEGGFVNHPSDPGGMTNLGVTKTVWEEWVGHPVDEKIMRNLTAEYVAPMYKKKYWDSCGCDNLAKGLDYIVFDFAVNAGPGRAIKTLQQALGVSADGVIGQGTMGAVIASNPHDLIDKYTQAKEAFYKSLSTFPTFGAGWLRRVAEVKVIAQSMLA